jgi:hypothetical protein
MASLEGTMGEYSSRGVPMRKLISGHKGGSALGRLLREPLLQFLVAGFSVLRTDQASTISSGTGWPSIAFDAPDPREERVGLSAGGR